ncbi:hypothetical protein [Salinibacterium sp. SWN167]|uniref:hypothetical protein n=1 Tax=Salinibacterium sp. SWN167 TaxID=2792054 RepID=UPI0018CFC1DE|nr:hypothetical protein [Salinibacterium sp. SWN167]MBH0082108.1 hypothetical protein [Salinibacterium sp. SWN167]
MTLDNEVDDAPKSALRRFILDRDLWNGLLLMSLMAGPLIALLLLLGWIVPALFRSEFDLRFWFYPFIVALIGGAAWGVSCALGAILMRLVVRRRTPAIRPQAIAAATGGAIGAIALPLIFNAALLGADLPLLLSLTPWIVGVALLAAAGLGTYTAVKLRSDLAQH